MTALVLSSAACASCAATTGRVHLHESIRCVPASGLALARVTLPSHASLAAVLQVLFSQRAATCDVRQGGCGRACGHRLVLARTPPPPVHALALDWEDRAPPGEAPSREDIAAALSCVEGPLSVAAAYDASAAAARDGGGSGDGGSDAFSGHGGDGGGGAHGAHAAPHALRGVLLARATPVGGVHYAAWALREPVGTATAPSWMAVGAQPPPQPGAQPPPPQGPFSWAAFKAHASSSQLAPVLLIYSQ